eukprot:1376228-Amorphochlora_amoeboformis.AAC.3
MGEDTVVVISSADVPGDLRDNGFFLKGWVDKLFAHLKRVCSEGVLKFLLELRVIDPGHPRVVEVIADCQDKLDSKTNIISKLSRKYTQVASNLRRVGTHMGIQGLRSDVPPVSDG